MRTCDGTNDKYLVHLIIVFAHIVSKVEIVSDRDSKFTEPANSSS